MREKIFQAVIGSHLYGTSRPQSDEDFLGVYLPTAEDLCSMQSPPGEISENVKLTEGRRNSAGDVDSKFFSVKRFFELALQGQTTAIELFFVPDELVTIKTPLWDEIKAHRSLFLSKQSVAPFVGFCRSQAGKATLKGQNLKQLQKLIKALEALTENDKKRKIMSFVDMDDVSAAEALGEGAMLFGMEFPVFLDQNGIFHLVVCNNRKLTINNTAESWLTTARILEERYGTRVRTAADTHYDYKSLYHAFRIAGEAEELLVEGRLSLPRPQQELEFLMALRAETFAPDYMEQLEACIAKVEALKSKSSLPDKPDYDAVGKLCIDLHRKLFNA